MPISVKESINWPGAGLTADTPKVTGDDRFGFDESAGTSWVLDGATDLGPFRLFKQFESDAAWMAEFLNRELMSHPPKGDLLAYFGDILAAVRKRAEKKSKVDIETAPRETWPIASGMWMWHTDDVTTFVRSGDCVALIRTPDGKTEVLTKHEQSDLEARTSRELNAMSPEDRMAGLRKIRATQNTDPQHVLLGLSPQGVDTLVIETRNLPEGSHILIMSDGLWRVVDPYAMMTAERMMDEALSDGVEHLARLMRKFEKADSQDAAARIKKSDDACGVLVEIRSLMAP
ncbi:protein phosphatase 2C domain-containing protein [Ponticaulis sp.]|uniref:protein phosphatase 2C domain-containing protein n=1 Tax=Ponticaulis sp. TaxID=2020902 RepID=UPI0025E21B55|nr:protein phosphatase 2C domain-containing protein [Ponticaulis sp.]